jgi:hypothetical protein
MTAGADSSLASRLTDIALAWLSGLESEGRRQLSMPFDSSERRDWDYRPGDREGLAIRDMSGPQRAAAMRLVDTALSARGAEEVRAVLAREALLGEQERRAGRTNWARRDPERYWYALFGVPDRSMPWGWRIDGHHVSVHVTVVGDAVAITPLFLGANPARVPPGLGDGPHLLAGEERLARELLASLTPSQKAVAIVEAAAPDDILTSNLRRFDPALVPVGIRYADLQRVQRDALERLVRHYLGRATAPAAGAAWSKLGEAGLADLAFAWAGPEAPGHGHYYAVRGESLLIEYDNTQNGANHVHSVWRDARSDWGDDLLAAHYAAFDHA